MPRTRTTAYVIIAGALVSASVVAGVVVAANPPAPLEVADVVTTAAESTTTVEAPGPALSVTPEELDAALTCSGPLTGLTRDPVLFTPAFSTAEQSFSRYQRQLPEVGITNCALTVPGAGYGDLQDSAEYVVAAVRLMSEESGRQVALVGHQHGALNELWALTFWPDIPGKVSDLISLATPYQGTQLATPLCDATHLCAPATWQIAAGSDFLDAINTRVEGQGLPAGPSYTSIATAFDEVIVPQPAVSVLPGATNIQLQDVCPLRPVEHFSILFDNLAYELVLDALNHDGPADPARIPASTCVGPVFMPGVTTAEGAAVAAADIAGAAIGALYGAPTNASVAEPELRPYAR